MTHSLLTRIGTPRHLMYQPFRPFAMQLVDRPQYPLPRRKSVQVAPIEHGIRPHGGMDRRVESGSVEPSSTQRSCARNVDGVIVKPDARIAYDYPSSHDA